MCPCVGSLYQQQPADITCCAREHRPQSSENLTIFCRDSLGAIAETGKISRNWFELSIMMWLYGISLCHCALLHGRMLQRSTQEMIHGTQNSCLFLLEHHWQALPLKTSGAKSSRKCTKMSWNKWAPGQIF